ncbi:MAG: sensor histidine kinase [Rhodoferax sp.]|nr:sensor histidine kinase [Rhodoferax sp.]
MIASRHSVQRRLVAYVSLTMLFLVAFAVALTYHMSYQHEVTEAVTLERDLVRTVQAQAEVAVFAANENIAKGVIEGLRTNLNIKGVRLTSLNPTEFAFSGGSFELEDELSLTTYALMSPVDGLEKIGVLTVIRNDLLVQEQASMWALRQSAMFLGQIALTAVVIMLFSHYLIGKPLVHLAKNLAAIKPGSGKRVHVAPADAGNEIGSLADNANALLDATEAALAEVGARAIKLKESNDTLATTLDNLQTTQTQLEHANQDFRRLLDNSGEGFLSFGADLVVDAQYSLACESMLGRSPALCQAPELIFAQDPDKAELLRAVIASVVEATDPDVRQVMLSLLPARIEREGMTLKIEYKALDKGKFMVVLSDITAERRMAALLESERQRLELIVAAVCDSRNFFETIDAFRSFLASGIAQMLHSASNAPLLAKELLRAIHTYKGLLSQFSFPGTPKALHAIETSLSELLALGAALEVAQIARLVSVQDLQTPLEADLALLREALGEDFLLHGDSIVLTQAQARQFEALAIQLLRGENVDTSVGEIRTLLEQIGTLRKVSFKDVLLGFDGLVRQAAKRMEKEVAPLQVSGDQVWIDPNDYRAFLHALVHVFRNAVAHGIETPEERWAARKDETGHIHCSVALERQHITLCIADDGAGINLNALRTRAVANGIYAQEEVAHIPDETIAQLVFRDAISTQTEVSELAGRGMGLAAVHSETLRRGGAVVVKTTPGQGTQFLFTLPLS